MASVREVAFELFREHEMTTMFGNPGSTELPMLAEFPDDFRYVLGLQEAVAVGMADGYAQASGRPAHVNLHTAPGVGNGMGAIFNAQANHEPDQPRCHAGRGPVRQVELRAAARPGCTARPGTGDPHRVAGSEGTGLRLPADGRLE
jgi:thiamine pyrophosphate-dependent acetolactate synthase large subunit-like protein